MKKTALFLLLIIICAAFSRVSADGPCGENASWTLSDDGVLTISGSGPMEDYQYVDKSPWYNTRAQIRKIVIEEGITAVGNKNFYGCTYLTEVRLPETLTAIGDAAFDQDSHLALINVPEGITSIGKTAFRQCSSLTVFPIPSGLEAIEDYAFSSCIRLGSVTLPEGLTSIGEAAFANCDSLTGIVIPASVTYISEKEAFAWCNNLREIKVDPGNDSYVSADGVLFNKDQSKLLYYPAGKTAASYTVPASVTSINDHAFASGTHLVSLTIPGSVKEIGEGAFSESRKLTNISLSEGLKSIGDKAFHYCPKLAGITLPASLAPLENDPFYGCDSLQSINIAEGSKYMSSIDGVLFSADKTVLISYPRTRIDGTYAVPEGVEKIGEGAFAECNNLVSVTFPDSLTEIGENAFNGCERLTDFTLPEGLVTIGDSAFDYVPGPKRLVIPQTVGTIGYEAFYDCENLAEVIILNPETDLEDAYSFIGCNEELTISGFAGSTAEAYADEYDIPFIVMEEIPEEYLSAGHQHAGGSDPWTCAECGAEMSGGNYCGECGAPRPQALICGNCGYEAPEGKTFKFCPECGSPMPALPARTGADLRQLDTDALNALIEQAEEELKRR